MACRALGHWPRDLADLIAEYSDWTLNEKVVYLTGTWMPFSQDDDMHIVLSAPGLEILWYSEYRTLRIRIAHLGLNPKVILKSVAGLGDAILSRDWTGGGYSYRPMPMSESEIATLDKWLETVK